VLAVALFFVTIVALAAGAMLEGGLAFARVSAKHAAEHYVELGLASARSALLSQIGSEIASGAQTLEAPPSLAAAPACPANNGTCPFVLSAQFALGGTLGGTDASNAVATDLQTYPAISEGRVAATIVETVESTAGVRLASRTEYLTLRTFAIPPYVAVDGTTDAAGARDAPYEADAAGCDPTTPNACDTANESPPATPAPAGTMNPADTRIHALAQCSAGGSGACASQPFASADPPNFSSETTWYNTNAQSDGWAR